MPFFVELYLSPNQCHSGQVLLPLRNGDIVSWEVRAPSNSSLTCRLRFLSLASGGMDLMGWDKLEARHKLPAEFLYVEPGMEHSYKGSF